MHNTKTIQIRSYIIGFILSVIFTLIAYFFVQEHVVTHHTVFSHTFLMYAVFTLAFLQLAAQLYFFLHLGRPQKRWDLLFFMFTFGIILIVVVGAIWIMYHLNYNMTPQQIKDYLNTQQGM